jgi:hypothetical protein
MQQSSGVLTLQALLTLFQIRCITIFWSSLCIKLNPSEVLEQKGLDSYRSSVRFYLQDVEVVDVKDTA